MTETRRQPWIVNLSGALLRIELPWVQATARSQMRRRTMPFVAQIPAGGKLDLVEKYGLSIEEAWAMARSPGVRRHELTTPPRVLVREAPVPERAVFDASTPGHVFEPDEPAVPPSKVVHVGRVLHSRGRDAPVDVTAQVFGAVEARPALPASMGEGSSSAPAVAPAPIDVDFAALAHQPAFDPSNPGDAGGDAGGGLPAPLAASPDGLPIDNGAVPDRTWRNDRIRAWAAEHGYELPASATTKALMLTALDEMRTSRGDSAV